MFLVQREGARFSGYFRFFDIANWMLSVQIITLPGDKLEFSGQILNNERSDID